MFAGVEWIVVGVVVLAIFFFGKKRVIEWAKTFGEAKKAFKEVDKEETEEKKA